MAIKLTEHQQSKVDKVIDNLGLFGKALLSGVAGTGKTTSVEDIIKSYQKRHKSVWITGTTHKSVEVISKMSALSEKRISTIHSFLNLVPDRTGYNKPMVKNPKANDNFTDLLIIEEYSMLTKDVIYHLENYLKMYNTQVLFVGDASQLILNHGDIDALGLEKVSSYLTEPMRQGEMSDIALYTSMVSKFILGKGPEPSVPFGDEIVKYENHTDFINAWKRCKTDDKAILAFKNVTVKTYNTNISKHFRNQALEYVAGNRVVLRSVVFTEAGDMIPNRRTVELTKVDDKGDYYEVESDYGRFKINKTAVWLNAQTKHFAAKMDWNSFYKFREKFVMVHHADALTVYGAQGSTYEEVFIDASDMMTAQKDVRRMAYVSISRAKKRAHIYMGTSRDYKAFEATVEDSLI